MKSTAPMHDKTTSLVNRLTTTNILGAYVDTKIDKTSHQSSSSACFEKLQKVSNGGLFINFGEYNRINQIDSKQKLSESKNQAKFITSPQSEANRFRVRTGDKKGTQAKGAKNKSQVHASVNSCDSPLMEPQPQQKDEEQVKKQMKAGRLQRKLGTLIMPSLKDGDTHQQLSSKLDTRLTLFEESDEDVPNPMVKFEENVKDPFDKYYKTDFAVVMEQVDIYNKRRQNRSQKKMRDQQQDSLLNPLLIEHTATPSINFNLAKQYQLQTEVLPRRFLIPKNPEGQVDLKLQHYYVGAKHATVLGELLQDRGDQFRSVNLEGCSLNQKSCVDILQRIKQAPSQLSLAKNKIGGQSCQILGSIISNRRQNLKELNIEGSKLGNKAAVNI